MKTFTLNLCYHAKIPDSKVLTKSAFAKDYEIIAEFERFHHANGFDHPVYPVITNQEPRMIQAAEWGLVPYNMSPEKAKDLQKRTLNAIGEEVWEKSAFKHLIGVKRCIIIVEGFYEWMHVGTGSKAVKYPYYIHPKEDEFFFMGGVWNEYNGKNTSVIMTTAANSLMERIHNSKKRMPFILDKAQIGAWLADIRRPEIDGLIKPFDESKMAAHTISRKFNHFQKETTNIPEISDVVEYPELSNLFS